MKNKKKYDMGGILASLGQTGLDMAMPGLGSIVSPLIGLMQEKAGQVKVLQDHFKSMSSSTSPYGNYEKGGTLGDGVHLYDGLSHAMGGIGVNNDGVPSVSEENEVEDGEVKVKYNNKVVIFSKKLKIK